MDKRKPDYFSDDRQATVPTPPDQQDVSPLDMVSDAVAEMMDRVRDGAGLKDGPLGEERPDKSKTART